MWGAGRRYGRVDRHRDGRKATGARRLVGLTLLAAAFAFGPLAGAVAGEHEFVGHKKCRSCHKKEAIGNQYGWWLEDAHASAWEKLGGEQAKKWAAERGIDDPQQDEQCVECHVTAYGVPDEMVSRKFDRTAGVQCEGCHGAGKDYRKKRVMVDRELSIEKGLIIPDEKLCRECHNADSPAWDPKRYEIAGGTTGFDFDQAVEKIRHPVPEGYDPLAEGEAD